MKRIEGLFKPDMEEQEEAKCNRNGQTHHIDNTVGFILD